MNKSLKKIVQKASSKFKIKNKQKTLKRILGQEGPRSMKEAGKE